MVDEAYRNAFREVYLILENTEKELLEKIPNKFIDFIKNNMNEGYKPNLKFDEPLEKQKTLKETEGMIALIYRTYLATDEEKKAFLKRTADINKEKENEKRNTYKGKTSEEFFKSKNQEDMQTTVEAFNNQLAKNEENFFKKLLTKLIKLFKR